MTITYDPQHPAYADEFDVRNEASRIFDICITCGTCADFCGTFTTLFQISSRLGRADAGLMTPQQQDAIVDPCVVCGLCVEACPFTPGDSELAIDFQAFMLRHRAMRLANGQVSWRERLRAMPLMRRIQKK